MCASDKTANIINFLNKGSNCQFIAHLILLLFCNPYLTRQVKSGHFPLQCNGLLGELNGDTFAQTNPPSCTYIHNHTHTHTHTYSIYTVIGLVQCQPYVPNDNWYVCCSICCSPVILISLFQAFFVSRHNTRLHLAHCTERTRGKKPLLWIEEEKILISISFLPFSC